MSKHLELLSEDSDNSGDEIPIYKTKRDEVIIDSTDEEEIYLSQDKSEYATGKDSTHKSHNSLLVTSTPGDERTESYLAESFLDNCSQSKIILQSDVETLDPKDDKKNLPHYGKRMSFVTQQNKSPEIADDTETDDSDIDSDLIDTSQIMDDSFDAATPKKPITPNVSANKGKKTISPKFSTGDYVTISSDSDENNGRLENLTKKIDGKVQTKLNDMFKKLTPSENSKSTHASPKNSMECKRSEYNEQLNLIKIKEQEMMQAKRLLTNCNIASLPDKGELLKKRFEQVKLKFLEAQNRLRDMIVVEEDISESTNNAKKSPLSNWNNLEAGLAIVQPKTFGKKGLENYQNQKALTIESLEQLHGSLKNCPKEDQMADEPKGLKVNLMDHQRRALAWMTYREQQKPPGGILADDMGLGKTLTMIALVLNTIRNDIHHDETDDEETSKKHGKYEGGTLVVCPASLLNQWAQEIDTKLKRGMLSYNIYHGSKRETKPKRLAENDVVITTYSIVMNEMEKKGAIFRVRWRRIILDEAHQIRNHKSQTSIACCALASKYRWALTGTPVHNKELDMYALLKFLRCSPFDDLSVWKRWVGDKNSGGGERLNTVISSLMLRRTKAELISQGKLNNMPSRKWDLIPVTLDESEMSLYQKILLFSQTLFAQFLHQKAEKSQDIINIRNLNADPNSEYFKMRKKLLALNGMREVNQHEILVLLLRLRQICCHPSLIVNMLQGDEDLGDDEPEEKEEINLLEQLNKLNLNEESDVAAGISADKVGFKEATKEILNPSHPLFAKDRVSSKVKTALKLIPNILSSGDKIIIVSQWTSFLELIGWQLKEAGIKYTKLDGSVPTSKRTEMVNNFNDPNSKVKVLLLSLTAGGVGLNLVGANHLFLLDLHWNPQLENQAQDRIYRMGQKKNVNIYKFMASETIEERIKKLQEDKIEISESMLTGSKRAIGSKLSLQDLKMLFNM